MIVRIEIPGRIVAKQSVRFTRAGHRYQPGDVMNYHGRVAAFAYEAMSGDQPIEGACRVEVQIVLQTPASWSRKRKERHNWCTAKPDLDNACKALLDGLKGVVFADDRQVVELTMRKSYGGGDRVVVTVEALEEPAQTMEAA